MSYMRFLCSPSLKSPILRPFRSHSPRIADNEGRFTIDKEKAKAIYDEYQQLLLDQVPMTYIVYPLSFLAVRDKWANVFYDTLGGLDSNYLYLPDAE